MPAAKSRSCVSPLRKLLMVGTALAGRSLGQPDAIDHDQADLVLCHVGRERLGEITEAVGAVAILNGRRIHAETVGDSHDPIIP